MDYALESLERLLPGLVTSLALTGASLLFALPLGLLAGWMLTSKRRWIRTPVIGAVELFRGFPALLTLYIAYFGLVTFGIFLDGFTAVVVAFGLTSAAYSAEVFRAGFASFPKGLREAAASLALSPSRTARLLVIPHVGRVTVVPLLGIAIITFQGTSLALAVGVLELTGRAFNFGMANSNILPEFIMVGIIYLLVTSLLSLMEIVAERRARRLGEPSKAERADPRTVQIV